MKKSKNLIDKKFFSVRLILIVKDSKNLSDPREGE